MREPEIHHGAPSHWTIGPDRLLALEPFALMGIVNVTPDSFSDGGNAFDADAAIAQALRLAEEGAQIVDIGGESTRPGATSVDAREQIRRVIPVITAIRASSRVAISIDTTSAEVAIAAIQAGANIVNDVSAGEDKAMFRMCAECGCGIVLMHRLTAPSQDRYSDRYDTPPQYDDVVRGVGDALLARADIAMQAGMARESIAIDPGLGFGKSVRQNYELVARTSELASFGFPVVVGASRKSFIGAVTGQDCPADRVAGSLVVAVAAFGGGARIIRAHDVSAHREALQVAEAVLKGGGIH